MYEKQKAEIGRLQDRVAKGECDEPTRIHVPHVGDGLGAMAPGLYMQSAMAAPKQGGRFRQGVTGGATSDMLTRVRFSTITCSTFSSASCEIT